MRPEVSGNPLGRGSFSKANPRCPAKQRRFCRRGFREKTKKPLESSGFLVSWLPYAVKAARTPDRHAATGVVPITVMIAVIEAIAVAPEPVAAAVKAVVAPSHPAAEPVAHTGQNSSDAASGRRRGSCTTGRRHRRFSSKPLRSRPCDRRATQPRHLIDGCLLLVRVIRVVLPGLHPGVGTVDPQLGEITDCLFHRRPQLLLIRRQRKAGVDRRNPRIGESRPVLRTDCTCSWDQERC